MYELFDVEFGKWLVTHGSVALGLEPTDALRMAFLAGWAARKKTELEKAWGKDHNRHGRR